MEKNEIIAENWSIKGNLLKLGNHNIRLNRIDSFAFSKPLYTKIFNFIVNLSIFIAIALTIFAWVKYHDNILSKAFVFIIFIIIPNAIIDYYTHKVIIFSNGKKFTKSFIGSENSLSLDILEKELIASVNSDKV